MKTRHASLFAAILIAYAVLAGASIWRSSTVFDGERYFSLSDDPMISMRYARNLIAGHGAVWNAGEQPVEGYTNPAWMLAMAGVHGLPLAPSKLSAVMQVLEAFLLVVNLFVVRRLAIASGADARTAVAAAFLTSVYSPLTGWSLAGFETGVLVVMVGMALTSAVDIHRRQQFSSVPYWILGVATLVRLDAAVVYVAVLIVLVMYNGASRARHIRVGSLILVAFLAGQTAWRLAYYGDWLPNTYYLKMTGYPLPWRVWWGAYNLMGFAWRGNWFLLAAALFALVRRNFATTLLASTVVFQFAYAAYSGASDTRFTTTVMPLVFILCALGLSELGTRMRPAVARLWPPLNAWSGWSFALAVVLIGAGISGMSITGLASPSDDLTPLVLRVRVLDDITMPAATIAVVSAGALPYFLDRPAIDLLGKNDRTVAREPAHSSFSTFESRYVSGHVKWDYAYSIGTLRPDVVADLWKNPDEAAPYLSAYRPIVIADRVTYLRNDSTNIRWDRVARYEARAH